MPKRFALITTQVEEFETKDELEHYIKEHSPLDFDEKVDLLASGKIVIDGENDASITIEVAKALEGQEDATEPTTEGTTTDGPRTN